MSLLHARGFARSVFSESPWYCWLEPMLSTLAEERFPDPEHWTERHRELAASRQVPALRFMASPPKKPRRRTRKSPVVLGELYEGRIVERNEVPTRLDDWHDFFNALAFMAFPAAKWALHVRQYHLLAARLTPEARRLPGARTREQDALSLLDEGGILIALSREREHELMQGSADGADAERFEARLLPWLAEGVARAVPFGHALYEHLVLGRDDMLGTPVVIPMAELPPWDSDITSRMRLRAALDDALSALLCERTRFKEPTRARGLSLASLVP